MGVLLVRKNKLNMSWMDIRMAQQMKSQKLAADAKKQQLATQKGVKGVKSTATVDLLTKNRLDAQKKAEHAKREGLGHHKGDQKLRSEKGDFDYAPPAGEKVVMMPVLLPLLLLPMMLVLTL